MKKTIILFLFIVSSAFCQNIQNQSSKILILDPWIRPSAEGSNSAFFFVVENTGKNADTLVAAKSSLSEVVEVHEMFKKGDMMGMCEVPFVAIPAKSKVEFKPRDIHVMLIKMKNDLKIGETGEVVLVFKHAGEIKVKAAVRDMPKMNGMKHQ